MILSTIQNQQGPFLHHVFLPGTAWAIDHHDSLFLEDSLYLAPEYRTEL